MNNELQEHKTSDKIKWILTLVAFILVGIMLTGIILGWFEKEDKPEQRKDNNIIVTPTEQSAMRLHSARAATGSNSYTITATVTPSDATNKDIAWSISWKNASGSWSSGKNVNDYITLTAADNTATVTLKTAFSEQAIITATSESNPEVTVTCTVDYVKRLSIPHGNAYMDVKRIYQNGNTDQTFSFGLTMNFKAIVQYNGIGTVSGTVEFGQLTISIDEGMREYISSRVSGYNSKYTNKALTYNFADGLETNVNLTSPTNLFNFMGNPSETSGAITNAFIAACNAGHKIRLISTFTYSYNGTTLQSGQIIGNFTVDTSGVAIAVTGMSVDNTSIAF